MNHEEQVILYAAGRLDERGRLDFEEHLIGCPQCQAELQLWQLARDEVVISSRAVSAPPGLDRGALERIRRPSSLAAGLRNTWQLLRLQSRLVQREMWPASAAVMALGLIMALLSDHLEFIYFFTPLLAAASLAGIFGPESDPALELTLATRTSPWKVLLARMSLVSIYNLLLTLAAAALLLAVLPPGVLGALILGWLGPMAFLSALALLLSLWVGTGNAILASYSLWVVQFIPFHFLGQWLDSPGWKAFISAYQHFWHDPSLLLVLSAPLVLLALWSANRRPLLRPA